MWRALPGLTRWLAAGALAMAWCSASAATPAASTCAWYVWATFWRSTVSADGRVIDSSNENQVTVSEGQAYGLFFALVANDRATFVKMLSSTANNLAQGLLSGHLPAWNW